MRFLKITAATALAAVMLLPLAAGSAQAARGMQVAVQDDGVFTNAYYGVTKGLKDAAGLHASYIRILILWADVRGANGTSRKAPKHVHYDFRGAYDGAVYGASLRHIKVQFVLAGPAPAWATANHRKGPERPSVKAFAEFAKQAAAHFKGKVDRFSIWNEPNFRSWLSPQSTAAAQYRQLYIAGYNAIKGQNPSASVLFGETSPYSEGRNAISPLRFMRDVLQVNGSYRLKRGAKGLKADGYAHHPYDFYHSPYYRYPGADNVTMSTLSRLDSALTKAFRSGALTTPQGGQLPVYLTEYGFMSSGPGRLSASKHATYLKEGFALALKAPRVQEVVQYTLLPPHGRYKFFDLSIEGSRGQKLKPYTVLAAWVKAEVQKGLVSAP